MTGGEYSFQTQSPCICCSLCLKRCSTPHFHHHFSECAGSVLLLSGLPCQVWGCSPVNIRGLSPCAQHPEGDAQYHLVSEAVETCRSARSWLTSEDWLICGKERGSLGGQHLVSEALPEKFGERRTGPGPLSTAPMPSPALCCWALPEQPSVSVSSSAA